MGLIQAPPAILNNSASSAQTVGVPSSPLARRYNNSGLENNYMNSAVIGAHQYLAQDQFQQQQQQPIQQPQQPQPPVINVRLPALTEGDLGDDRDESEPLIPPRTTSKLPGIRTVHPQTPPRGAIRGESLNPTLLERKSYSITVTVLFPDMPWIPMASFLPSTK